MVVSHTPYKTPVETYVFLNDVWLDDLYRLDWDLSRRREPIRGYNDIHYGQVAEGAQIIAGSLILHFTEPGYLTDAIEQGLLGFGPSSEQGKDPYRQIEKLRRVAAAEIDSIYTDTIAGSSERLNRISNLISSTRKIGISDFVVNSLREAFTPDERRRTIFATREPIYARNRHFSIKIYYGHPEDPDAKIRVIHKCALFGTSQTISAASHGGGDMSSSAQPILEVYPFIGQRIENRNNTAAHVNLTRKLL